MNNERRTDNQYAHLNLVLSFFPRADSKTQFFTGLAIGMLGFLAAVVDLSHHWSWLIFVLSIAATGLLFVALSRLYQAAYPNLKGGEESLIYFNEIAKLREATFIDRVGAQSEEELFEDLVAQTWRNSKILSAKFASLKDAHLLIMCSIVPWVFATGLSIALKQNPNLNVP